MREDQVAAAAVEIELLAEVLQRHRRALDMPARASLAPRAVPGRLARLRGLPEREVHRMVLGRVDLDARAGLHVVETAAAELAVMRELLDAVVDIAVVDHIGVALRDELLDHRDDLRHRLTDARVDIGMADVQRIHRLEIGLDVAVGDVLPRHAFLVGRIDDLVVDIREVLDVVDLVALLGKVAADDVPGHEGACIADVRVVVRRDAAAVDADLALLERLELLLAAGHRIVDFKHVLYPPISSRVH